MSSEKRLIDANALEARMGGLCDEFGTDHLFIDAIVYEIGNAPTVDAVEVVRCKECKWFMRNEEFNTNWGDCIVCGVGSTHMKKVDDFCSYGERKDNG